MEPASGTSEGHLKFVFQAFRDFSAACFWSWPRDFVVVEAYAPFALSTHLKDMGAQPYESGFCLSEVPLGDGYLDLKRIIGVLAKANPAIQFNLEMITRDPLKVPCLTDKFWATMENEPASRLAQMLDTVRKNASPKPLPQTSGLSFEQQLAFEDANVRQSLAHAREHLGL